MRNLVGSLILLTCTGIAFGQQPCPVDVMRAERYSQDGLYQCTVRCGHVIDVDYRNTSGKTVVGVTLGVEMYDAEGKARTLFFDFRDRELIAPGDATHGSWGETIYYREYPRVNVFVKKVLFADNTEWNDDASGSCNSGLHGFVPKGASIRKAQSKEVAKAPSDSHGTH